MRRTHLSTPLAFAIAATVLLLVSPAPAAAQNPPTSEYDIPSNADIHYIDLGDGGDNPWEGGCHWHYGNDECSAPDFFFMGDYCSPDGKILYEWTNERCHEPEDDLREYNCETACRKKTGGSGRCSVLKRHCLTKQTNNPDATTDSAVCICDEG